MSKSVSHQLVDLLKSLCLANDINSNAYFVVGVSGGKDSMALLHLLNSFAKNLHAVHINYGQRAEESDADQALVKDYCTSLGIEFSCFDAPNFERGNFQNEARKFRYQCFNEVAVKNQRIDYYVCTAHHKKDQVETILHNIFEGKSIALYKGMEILSDIYFKPLLKTSEIILNKYIEENDIPWRLDKSNLTTKYKRNFIRNKILPGLQKEYVKIENNILKLTDISYIYNSAIKHIAHSLFENEYALDLNKWLLIEPKLQTAILAFWFHNRLKLHEVSEKTINELCIQLNGDLPKGWENKIGNQKSIASDWVLNLSDNILYAFNKADYQKIDTPSKIFEDTEMSRRKISDTVLLSRELDSTSFNKFSTNELWFCYEGNTTDIKYRSIKDGDKFKPIGLKGKSKKINDILAEEGIPSSLRKYAKIIFANSEILALLFPQSDYLLQTTNRIGLIAEHAKLDNRSETIFKITKQPSQDGHLQT